MDQVTNSKARQVALEVYKQQHVIPTSLIKYQSNGQLLIIGTEEAVEFASSLNAKLDVTVLLTEDCILNNLKGTEVILLENRTIEIEGYLGEFSICLTEQSQTELKRTIKSDLILDLSSEPLLSQLMLPNGYFTSATDKVSLQQMASQLEDMIGSFEKPKFINYNADICAHSHAGKTACTQCIDACPAEAISSIKNKVSVDTFLCQGGGICATICPTGAMTYVYPRTIDLLENIRVLMNSYREHGGENPIIAFYADSDDVDIELAKPELVKPELPKPELPKQGNILRVNIEELASVGLEVWLALLAYGAGRVLLVDRGKTPPQILAKITQQIQLTKEILSALGYAQDSVSLISSESLSATIDVLMPQINQGSFEALGGKRAVCYLALDHLYQQAEKPHKMANFTGPAMFGTAFVEDNCTLCYSCVEACPGKALKTGEGIPQLNFIEANCVQCGMCTRTCPENAISISPRLLFEHQQRQQVKLLFEESPFNCISCGKAFATHSVIQKMLTKLSDHWMFKTERARNRLKMCDDCRVVDMVQDDTAMNAEKEQSLH